MSGSVWLESFCCFCFFFYPFHCSIHHKIYETFIYIQWNFHCRNSMLKSCTQYRSSAIFGKQRSKLQLFWSFIFCFLCVLSAVHSLYAFMFWSNKWIPYELVSERYNAFSYNIFIAFARSVDLIYMGALWITMEKKQMKKKNASQQINKQQNKGEKKDDVCKQKYSNRADMKTVSECGNGM